MNETLKIIGRRYSCRSFTGVVPTDRQLQAVAEAAVCAPSGMNRQGWRIIVVKNPDLMEDLETEGLRILASMPDRSVINRVKELGGTLFYNAPCMIVIASATGTGTQLDCGIITQTVALAATSLGLGNLICGMAGLAFTGKRAGEFRQRLGFPEGYEFGAAVLLGYSTAPTPAHEPDLTKISFVR